MVQERARKAQRNGGEAEDAAAGFGDARAGEGLDVRALGGFGSKVPVPTVPAKDAVAAVAPQALASKSKTSLSKFGRLGGGRPKR